MALKRADGMKDNEESTDLCFSIWESVSNLVCLNQENTQILVTLGVMDLAMRALQKYKENPSINKAVWRSIKNMGYEADDDMRASLGRLVTEDKILPTLTKNGEEYEVIEEAMGTAANLGAYPPKRPKFLKVFRFTVRKLA